MVCVRWELEKQWGPSRCVGKTLWQSGPNLPSGLEQTSESAWTLKSAPRRSRASSTMAEGGGLEQTVGIC